ARARVERGRTHGKFSEIDSGRYSIRTESGRVVLGIAVAGRVPGIAQDALCGSEQHRRARRGRAHRGIVPRGVRARRYAVGTSGYRGAIYPGKRLEILRGRCDRFRIEDAGRYSRTIQ